MLSRIPTIKLLGHLASRPGYLPIVAKGLWRKHLNIKKDLQRNDGRALKPPLQISLRITNRCNQKCGICGQFGDEGYMRKENHKQLLNELDLKTYKGIVDQVARYRPVFYITGGEAFLYQDLFRLTKYIKERKCPVYVITNGSLLHEHAEEIVQQKWDLLTSSFDGPEEIHDACRGIKGTFQRTKKGIAHLLEVRKKSRKKRPFFSLSATLSKMNQAYIPEIFETAAQIKPDLLIVYLSWFTNEEMGNRHAGVLKDNLGVDAFTWKSYVGQNQGIDTNLVKKSLSAMREKKLPFDWLMIPDIPMGQIPRYYQAPSDFLGYGPCVSPYLMVDIMPNGNVVTCRDFIDVRVGSVKETPLLEIWNNPLFCKFRNLLKTYNGTLPQCSRCCGLMGF